MLSRRQLLTGAAGVAVALPLVTQVAGELPDGAQLDNVSHPLGEDSLEWLEITIEGRKAFLPIYK